MKNLNLSHKDLLGKENSYFVGIEKFFKRPREVSDINEASPGSKNFPVTFNQIDQIDVVSDVAAVLVNVDVQLNSSRVVWSDERLQNLIGVMERTRRRQTEAPIDG